MAMVAKTSISGHKRDDMNLHINFHHLGLATACTCTCIIIIHYLLLFTVFYCCSQ